MLSRQEQDEIEHTMREVHDNEPHKWIEMRRQMFLLQTLSPLEILGNTLLFDLISLAEQLPRHIVDQLTTD